MRERDAAHHILAASLPADIVAHILPYTYLVQPPALLHDVRNYRDTKVKLLDMYRQYWIERAEEPEPEDVHWLINDLIAYANDDHATMFGFVEPFYAIFRRHVRLHSHESVVHYVSTMLTKRPIVQINIVLGLFTPHERDEVVRETSKSFTL